MFPSYPQTYELVPLNFRYRNIRGLLRVAGCRFSNHHLTHFMFIMEINDISIFLPVNQCVGRPASFSRVDGVNVHISFFAA
ncbi:hypothetical protein DFO53_4602 [Enterobacter sp. AG5470]|nr:hypothetical protein DFO53_4602 [Enterobacter sp. AG5470]